MEILYKITVPKAHIDILRNCSIQADAFPNSGIRMFLWILESETYFQFCDLKDDQLQTTSSSAAIGVESGHGGEKISFPKGSEKNYPDTWRLAHLLFTRFLHTCMHITHRFKNSLATFEIGFVFTWKKKYQENC